MAALIDGMKKTTVLTNMEVNNSNAKFFFSMPEHNIKTIIYEDLREHGSRRQFVSDSTEGKTVTIIRLPIIKNPDEYASLFHYSNPVVGVTGNSSLFEVISLGKLPLYDFNMDIQFYVNSDMAIYTEGELLNFFDNYINPEEKAAIAKSHRHLIAQWSKKIVESKSLNKKLIRRVKTFLHQQP